MSKVIKVETQGIASPIRGLTMVAVLCVAPDGWRCYEAAHVIDIGADFEAQKSAAVLWTHQHGNKLSKPDAGKYFTPIADLKFAA